MCCIKGELFNHCYCRQYRKEPWRYCEEYKQAHPAQPTHRSWTPTITIDPADFKSEKEAPGWTKLLGHELEQDFTLYGLRYIGLSKGKDGTFPPLDCVKTDINLVVGFDECPFHAMVEMRERQEMEREKAKEREKWAKRDASVAWRAWYRVSDVIDKVVY